MVAEVYAGLSALKTAFDLTKGLKNIHDATIRNAVIIELSEKIIAAREAQSAALDRIRELEEQVAAFETWRTDKQRYELQDVGLGSLAYVIKEGMRGSEPPHEICALCYQRGKKSILQPRDMGHAKMLQCFECKAQIKVGEIPNYV